MNFFHHFKNNTPSLLTHLIVIIIGILVFSTKTMTGLNIATVAEVFNGAFLALVILHIILFFVSYCISFLTAALWWFLPFTIFATLALSVIAGLLMAIPKFILSIIFAIQNRSLTKRSYQMT